MVGVLLLRDFVHSHKLYIIACNIDNQISLKIFSSKSLAFSLAYVPIFRIGLFLLQPNFDVRFRKIILKQLKWISSSFKIFRMLTFWLLLYHSISAVIYGIGWWDC